MNYSSAKREKKNELRTLTAGPKGPHAVIRLRSDGEPRGGGIYGEARRKSENGLHLSGG